VLHSRKEIFDAMTSESSMEGCDPDWRASVLFNSSQKDRDFVSKAISGSSSSLDSEIETNLTRDGKI
jgi:hypothetical protein